jgi:dTDP-4-dehydrorhamnose reductase
MRVVVTGREGQVVRSLIERATATSDEIVPLGRPDLELSGEPEAIEQALKAARPDAIVSAAAYTAVDKAESEPELAFAINARGAGAVARAASHLGVPLVHLSTDYVFDGSKPSPYTELDPTGPATVYGVSKLAGEEAVLSAHAGATILRTAWVYSPFGNNFVKTMLRIAAGRDEIAVVADQLGNPTCALDIADGVLSVLANLRASKGTELRGVFHLTSGGEASWAEFAEAIFSASRSLGGPTAIVRPIPTTDYPTPAKRPSNSRLDNSKLAQIHGVRLPDWRHSVEITVARLIKPRA